MRDDPRPLLAVAALVVGFMTQPWGGVASGQTDQATQTAHVRLGADRGTASVPFTVDDARSIEVEVVAPVAGLAVSVVGGSGQSFDERNAADFDASFLTFETGGQTDAVARDVRQLIRLPSLGPGFYRVAIEAREPLIDHVLVTVSVRTDSKLLASLHATESEIRLGDRVVLAATVLDGGSPVAGAMGLTTVVGEDGVPVVLSLFDEGRDGGARGDGLYSAALVPSALGTYTATAEITGFTRGGYAFARSVETEFLVRESLGELELRVVDPGRPVDVDQDGVFDQVVVAVAVRIPAAGRYQLFVRLRTVEGQSLIETVQVVADEGWYEVGVPFSASRLVATGEDGPSEIASVELIGARDGGRVEPSRRLTNAGRTQRRGSDRPPSEL